MATQTISGGSSRSHDAGARVYMAKKTFNVADTGTFASTGIATGDVLQLIKVPADTSVLYVWFQVVTILSGVGATAATCTLGDGDSANGWDASINLMTAAWYRPVSGTDAYAQNDSATYGNGRHYTAEDTIDATVTTDATLTAGVFEIHAMCIDIS